MENKGQSLPLSELKKLLADCFPVNPWIYWSDFLFSLTLGYSAFVLTEFLPLFSLAQIAAFVVSVLAIYRAALFIHELTHQERNALPGFSLAWNLDHRRAHPLSVFHVPGRAHRSPQEELLLHCGRRRIPSAGREPLLEDSACTSPSRSCPAPPARIPLWNPHSRFLPSSRACAEW
jgi:hypothetical protein